MPGEHEDILTREEGRHLFGLDPAVYEAGRPQYPEAVYRALEERCGLAPGRGSWSSDRARAWSPAGCSRRAPRCRRGTERQPGGAPARRLRGPADRARGHLRRGGRRRGRLRPCRSPPRASTGSTRRPGWPSWDERVRPRWRRGVVVDALPGPDRAGRVQPAPPRGSWGAGRRAPSRSRAGHPSSCDAEHRLRDLAQLGRLRRPRVRGASPSPARSTRARCGRSTPRSPRCCAGARGAGASCSTASRPWCAIASGAGWSGSS